jgi:hypothetical protein
MGTIQNSDVQLDLLSCKSEFLPWTPVYMHAITIDILQSSDRIKIQSHNGLQILTLIINVTGWINTGFILTGSINFWCVTLELRALLYLLRVLWLWYFVGDIWTSDIELWQAFDLLKRIPTTHITSYWDIRYRALMGWKAQNRYSLVWYSNTVHCTKVEVHIIKLGRLLCAYTEWVS